MNENYILAKTIVNYVADRLWINPDLILNAKQSQLLAPVRCICIHEIRANTRLKNVEIASMFNCSSHCMVSERLKTYNDLFFRSAEFKKMVRVSKFKKGIN